MKTLVSLLLGALFLLDGQEVTPPKANVPINSLTVNGFPLDSDSLSFNSPGALAVVEGHIRWSKRKAVPYQELVKRGGSAQQPRLTTHLLSDAEIWPTVWLRDVVVDPNPSTHKPVPFRVSLRRGGTVLRQWPTSARESIYSVQLAQIWLLARLGDELVVEPMVGARSQSGEHPGKRVIKLEKVNRPLAGGC